MKIEKSMTPLPQSAVNEAPARAVPPKTADAPAPQTSGVNVSLGSASSQLRSMGADVNGGVPAVDAKKVAEIKQAISEGRFQINSAAIADGLSNDVEELINASQS